MPVSRKTETDNWCKVFLRGLARVYVRRRLCAVLSVTFASPTRRREKNLSNVTAIITSCNMTQLHVSSSPPQRHTITQLRLFCPADVRCSSVNNHTFFTVDVSADFGEIFPSAGQNVRYLIRIFCKFLLKPQTIPTGCFRRKTA